MIRATAAAAIILAPLLAVLAACGAGEDAPVRVSDVTVFAPLPGQSTGVAYFTLENSTPEAVTLRNVSSPHFTAVEMHATVHDEGVAEMLPLDSITVTAFSDVVFSAGESHLMLIEPRNVPEPGDVVALEFHYAVAGADRTLTITAPVRTRGAH